jgi:hypothetical protein
VPAVHVLLLFGGVEGQLGLFPPLLLVPPLLLAVPLLLPAPLLPVPPLLVAPLLPAPLLPAPLPLALPLLLAPWPLLPPVPLLPVVAPLLLPLASGLPFAVDVLPPHAGATDAASPTVIDAIKAKRNARMKDLLARVVSPWSTIRRVRVLVSLQSPRRFGGWPSPRPVGAAPT